jgi:hypothetical protein
MQHFNGIGLFQLFRPPPIFLVPLFYYIWFYISKHISPFYAKRMEIACQAGRAAECIAVWQSRSSGKGPLPRQRDDVIIHSGISITEGEMKHGYEIHRKQPLRGL